MNAGDHFSADIERCRKRTSGDAPSGREKALRALFTSSLPAGSPSELADDLFGLYLSMVLPEAGDQGEALFAHADKLVGLCALINGEYDDVRFPDLFSVENWRAIGESVSSCAEDMDMDVLTAVMGVLLAKGAIGSSGDDEGDDDAIDFDDDEEEDEEED